MNSKMPQSEGGYTALDTATTNGHGSAIYQSTTEPTTSNSVFDSVKRAIGHVVGSNSSNSIAGVSSSVGVGHDDGHGGSDLIASSDGIMSSGSLNNSEDHENLLAKGGNGRQAVIVGSRNRDKIGKTLLLNTKMPSAPAHTAEEARLLGTMPVDPMDDIELRSVQLQFPHARGSIIEACDQRRIPTDKGDILVAIQGDATKPAILTYHDLGLNYATSFAGFFNFPLMRGLLENFCVYHVTAPGQEEGAPALPEDYVFPSMDELAAQLQFVLSHFGLKSVIGLGVGAGANILARFALANPDKVGALCLINCVSTQSGWIEWGYQSFNARFLRTKGMTQSVIDYLMWHHFGRNPEERNHDLVQMYRQHFEHGVNPTNLAMFINVYIHRNDLNISRTPPGTPGTSPSACTLKMPVINITGALSPHVDDTVTFNGRLDPTNSSWMKISDCAMVLEEQPAKLAEAFRLFLQGEGYATPLSTPASTPCGTKYQTYATIFFANFKEQQERHQREQEIKKQQQQQQNTIFKSRKLRETAINNTNSNADERNSDFFGIDDNGNQQASDNTRVVANGNSINSSHSNNSGNTANNNSKYYEEIDNIVDDEADADHDDEDDDDDDDNDAAQPKLHHSVNGVLYTAAGNQSQSNKIRITENPLPETVSNC